MICIIRSEDQLATNLQFVLPVTLQNVFDECTKLLSRKEVLTSVLEILCRMEHSVLVKKKDIAFYNISTQYKFFL